MEAPLIETTLSFEDASSRPLEWTAPSIDVFAAHEAELFTGVVTDGEGQS